MVSRGTLLRERNPAGSAAGHRPEDDERLMAGYNAIGERRVRRLVGEVLLAGVEADEWPPLPALAIPDSAHEHGVLGLDRVEDRPLGHHRARHVQRNLAGDLGQVLQVGREYHPDHGNTW